VKNCFVLAGVVKSAKKLIIRPDGILPNLCILSNYNNNTEKPLHNILLDTEEVSVLSTKPAPFPSPSQQLPSTRNIIANGVLSQKRVVEFIQSKNASISTERIEAIVSTYIAEAWRESINHDIAIAQMCEGTNYLRKRELLDTYNYGDLKKIGNKTPRFQSMPQGIRAHIQQLKGYASQSRLSGVVVDTARFNGIAKNRGKCATLDELFPLWVTKDLYKYMTEINTILVEMYSFRES
jgi:hypothetical protein